MSGRKCSTGTPKGGLVQLRKRLSDDFPGTYLSSVAFFETLQRLTLEPKKKNAYGGGGGLSDIQSGCGY
jgi:hypothetical protein